MGARQPLETAQAAVVRARARGGLVQTAHAALGSWLGRADVRAALSVTLGLRLLCSVVALSVPWLLPSLYPWLSPYQPDHFNHAEYPLGTPHPVYSPLDYLIRPWERWDTAWFVDIARHGFTTYGSTFFMPLYPLMMRLVAPLVGGDLVAAGLLVSTVAAFFLFQALYQLAERVAPGRGLGLPTLLVAALLPTSFFLMAGYTEALFLALALWAILAALNGRWGRVALLGALAALTRQQGVALAALALPAVGAWLRWGWERWHPRHGTTSIAPGANQELQAPSRTPLVSGAVPVLVYVGWVVGLAFAHAPLPWDLLSSQRAWNLRPTWPGSGVLADAAFLVTHRPVGLAGWLQSPALDASASLAALAALIAMARRLPPGISLYLAAVWVSAQIKVAPSGLTLGEGRYILELLPLCVLPAGWLARSGTWLRLTWVVVGAAGLILYLWLFVLWGWVA
jgi:hypothetical protein